MDMHTMNNLHPFRKMNKLRCSNNGLRQTKAKERKLFVWIFCLTHNAMSEKRNSIEDKHSSLRLSIFHSILIMEAIDESRRDLSNLLSSSHLSSLFLLSSRYFEIPTRARVCERCVMHEIHWIQIEDLGERARGKRYWSVMDLKASEERKRCSNFNCQFLQSLQNLLL